MNKIIGYARVSTVGQNIETQVEELRKAGCSEIYEEKVSGKNTDREELRKALRSLEKGDTLVVNSFSRFARNTKNLLEMVEKLESRGIKFRSLKEDISTKGATGRLMLTMLGALATFERELMLEKQRDGIEYAKAQGKYKGKARTIYVDDRMANLFERVEKKELKAKEALQLSGVSLGTYYKLKKEWEKGR